MHTGARVLHALRHVFGNLFGAVDFYKKAKDAGVNESALREIASYAAVKDSLRGAVIGPVLNEATPQRDVDRIERQAARVGTIVVAADAILVEKRALR